MSDRTLSGGAVTTSTVGMGERLAGTRGCGGEGLMAFTLAAPQLREALQTASAFMSDDDTLPGLNGVHFAPHEDLVAFEATNRYIASYETLKIEGEPFAATIPARVVASLLAVLTPIDVEDDPYDEMPAHPIEPFDLATFEAVDDKAVVVRLLGSDEVELKFTSSSGLKFPDIPLIIEQAEERSAHTVGAVPFTGVHYDPGQLAAAVAAIREREYDGPLHFAVAAKGKPTVIRQGDQLTVVVMSVKGPGS